MRRALLAVFFAGCSYTFDGSPPLLPLIGHAPSPDGLQQLEHTPEQQVTLLSGVDGAPWAAIYEIVDGVGVAGPVRAARLADPVIDFNYDAALETHLGKEKIYFVDRERDGDHVEVRRLGEPRSAAQVVVLDLIGSPFYMSPHDDAFASLADTGLPIVTVALTDGSYVGTFEADNGIWPGLPVFSDDGAWLFTYESDSTVVAHATSSDYAPVIGNWVPPATDMRTVETVTDWPDGHALVFCDARGVTVISYPDGATRTLDAASCRSPSDADGPPLPAISDDRYVYLAGDLVRSVALDGSAPPQNLYELQFHQQVVTWSPSVVAYSDTLPGQFEADAGDGWVAGWKFMERGIAARFSADLASVRYLEYAADDESAGELRAAPLGGDHRRLAANVLEYDELDDGRLLAASNHAFDGYQNRVIVIDEAAGTAREVADGAARYTRIPGSTDVLVELYTEKLNALLVRFPVPARGAP